MRRKTAQRLGPISLRTDGTFSRLLVRYSPLLFIAFAWEASARVGLVPAQVLPSLTGLDAGKYTDLSIVREAGARLN
jgi:hypothetical protein